MVHLAIQDVRQESHHAERMLLAAGLERLRAQNLLHLRGRNILGRLLLRPPHNIAGRPPTLVVLRLCGRESYINQSYVAK